MADHTDTINSIELMVKDMASTLKEIEEAKCNYTDDIDARRRLNEYLEEMEKQMDDLDECKHMDTVDVLNSIELLLKSMSTSMKNMETSLKSPEVNTDTNADMDALQTQLTAIMNNTKRLPLLETQLINIGAVVADISMCLTSEPRTDVATPARLSLIINAISNTTLDTTSSTTPNKIPSNISDTTSINTPSTSPNSTSTKTSDNTATLKAQLDNLHGIVANVYNGVKIVHFKVKKTSQQTIIYAEEAAIPSFSNVCKELVRLTYAYAHNSTNSAYRDEIRSLSNIIARNLALRAFLCVDAILDLGDAKGLIQGMGIEKGDHATPARVTALKKGLLAKDNDRLELRMLLDFLNYGCELIAGREAWCDDSAVENETIPLALATVRDKYEGIHCHDSFRIDTWHPELGFLFGSGKEIKTSAEDSTCINGFRAMGLTAEDEPNSDIPDMDAFRIVEKEIAVVCKCTECKVFLDEESDL